MAAVPCCSPSRRAVSREPVSKECSSLRTTPTRCWTCVRWRGGACSSCRTPGRSSRGPGRSRTRTSRPRQPRSGEAFAVTEDVTNRGVFCIAWEDALRYFQCCHLSWNPYLLYPTPDGLSRRPTRLACHGTFAYTLSVGQMPQLHIGVVKAPRRQRMHLVFSRHVSNAKDVHLESDENDNTVPWVSLKVYDITEYPSIAQSIGGSCVFGMCYCRRLASASDISVRMQPLNSVAYRKAASWLTSFDCPAGTSNLLVVVTRLGSPVKEPFNFTVTLHTELEQMRLPVLPQAGDAAAAATGSLMESANLTAGNLNAGVYMHLIPKTCLRCTTAVTGSFAKGKSCGGRMDGNTYVYNPQYVLTLTRPSMVSVRLSLPECDETTQLQLMQKWPPRDERVKAAKVPFGLRIGNGTSDASFIMRSRVYTYGGAVLDSALPHTLDYDANKLLGDRQVEETKKAQLQLLSAVPGRAASFNLYDLDDVDEVTVLLLAAVDKGHFVSPTLSKVMIDKQPLPQGTPGWSMRLFQANAGAAPLVGGRCKFDVEIALGTDSISFADKTKAGDLWADMRELCRDVRNCSSQLSSYVAQIVNLHRKAKTLPTVQANYLAELCMFIADYVKRIADTPRPPPQPVRCLPPLPAGDYVVVPSLWERGVPASYELVVETTEAHTLRPLPEEGEGWNAVTVSGQLLQGGHLRSTTAPLQLQKSDAVFQCSKIAVSLAAKGLLTCRLFVVGGDAETESERTYVNVSLFVESDPATMQMVASSGHYSAGGVALPITLVERQGLLVVSAHPPSKNKYRLRLYSNVGLTAALTV
ncbi:calpain protease-like protein [Strigomonas culicis]|uniref:Calpain protease-like protein n=1 Tax=Strigomonas culicis TaxID=28005 RepID=S9VVA6_9TRYP|nr:calpain protease-like protein [Strigomonas culicis]|eukprot:EPY27200.1 calpain protease-like protein [Strigomonas culicis]